MHLNVSVVLRRLADISVDVVALVDEHVTLSSYCCDVAIDGCLSPTSYTADSKIGGSLRCANSSRVGSFLESLNNSVNVFGIESAGMY